MIIVITLILSSIPVAKRKERSLESSRKLSQEVGQKVRYFIQKLSRSKALVKSDSQYCNLHLSSIAQEKYWFKHKENIGMISENNQNIPTRWRCIVS